MVKKIKKHLKFIVCCALIMSLVAPSYAALSASDGSAFVTKAEFDAALSDFNARLTTFEAGINSKIDSQVTSYLDRNGIWSGKTTLPTASVYCLNLTEELWHPLTTNSKYLDKTPYSAKSKAGTTSYQVYPSSYANDYDEVKRDVVTLCPKSGLVYIEYSYGTFGHINATTIRTITGRRDWKNHISSFFFNDCYQNKWLNYMIDPVCDRRFLKHSEIDTPYRGVGSGDGGIIYACNGGSLESQVDPWTDPDGCWFGRFDLYFSLGTQDGPKNTVNITGGGIFDERERGGFYGRSNVDGFNLPSLRPTKCATTYFVNKGDKLQLTVFSVLSGRMANASTKRSQAAVFSSEQNKCNMYLFGFVPYDIKIY